MNRRAALRALGCGALAISCGRSRAPAVVKESDRSAGPAPPMLKLPQRPRGAETGTEFFGRIEKLGLAAYEAAVAAAIEGGDVPPFERQLVRIDVAANVDGEHVAGAVHVACDYLAVGSDEDFLRVPMTPATAQRLCEVTDCILPTPKLVDDINRLATAKLSPLGMQAAPDDTVNRRDFLAHQRSIEAQRLQRGYRLGDLTSGIKKDIVLSAQLAGHLDRVIIYGWHKEDGEPIQPLSTLHGKQYADYSHGVRLISQAMEIQGKRHRLADVLRDPKLCALVSNEGPLKVTAYPT